MTPGDVLTCAACGAAAVVYSTSPATRQSGGALVVSWHGHRHEVIGAEAPSLCLPCRLAEFPREAPNRRAWICDEFARNGCLLVGAEWNTDERLEDALQRWISRGSPRLARIDVAPERGIRARVGPSSPPPPGVGFILDEIADLPAGILASVPKREGDAVYLKPKPTQGSLF